MSILVDYEDEDPSYNNCFEDLRSDLQRYIDAVRSNRSPKRALEILYENIDYCMKRIKSKDKSIKIKDLLSLVFEGKEIPPRPKKRLVDLMTKDEIVNVVKKAKCPMLKGLKLDSMTKEDIVAHLEKAKCPELAKLTA
jgi:hypothetical protein